MTISDNTQAIDNHLDAINLSKAESRSKWSFLGIIIPPLGLIIGLVAIQTANKVADKFPDRAKGVKQTAKIGLALSVLFLVAYFYIASEISSRANKVNNIDYNQLYLVE